MKKPKIALFADIHGNLEGLTAVLEDSQKKGCTEYACLGDIVGYNASPSECLECVRDLGCPVVKGNHDQVVSSNSSLEDLSELAAASLLWTRQQLNQEQKIWLKNLRMIQKAHQFTLVHSSLDSPSSWTYVNNKFDALANFSYQLTAICFYGHTHVPEVYVKDDVVYAVEQREIDIETNKKYFINVGSVGQPRDGDWRASYAIYDTEARTISIQRIEYDIETAQNKIITAGLPQALAHRLAKGK